MRVICGIFGVSVLASFMSCGATSKQSGSEVKNVFGSDDRVALTTDQYPWTAIGVLQGVGRCTGTLVARDWVLTAAHCVMDPVTKNLTTQPITFHPNLKNGSAATSASMNWVWWGTNDPDKFRGQDWALVRLNSPLGDTYGWLGTQPNDVNSFPGELTIAGYSTDFFGGNTAGIHHNCRKQGVDQSKGFVLHDCDAAPGVSGGPVLRMHNNQLTVFGLAVAERRNGQSSTQRLPQYSAEYANIAIPSAGFVGKLREALGQ